MMLIMLHVQAGAEGPRGAKGDKGTTHSHTYIHTYMHAYIQAGGPFWKVREGPRAIKEEEEIMTEGVTMRVQKNKFSKVSR
jgi:hypothetical protein